MYGIPICMTIAFGYYIWRQTQFIQKDLTDSVITSSQRLEGIIIKLIDQQKITQMELKHIRGYIEGIEDIMTKLIKEK